MKKPISVSNLTLDLYLDYVRPAAIAAGIIELTATEDGKQIYVTDTATADEIAHCMYCACMCAGNDGIERTHEEYVRHEAERMIGQLEVSIKYDLHGYGETLTALLDAMTVTLAPAEDAQVWDENGDIITPDTDTEEEEEEQNMKPEYKHIYVEEARRQLEARQDCSAWDRAVTEDAIDLLDTVNDRCEQVTRQFAETEEGSEAHVRDLFVSRVSLMSIMKNGAESWHDYSWGGCGLIYDGDIAEHYCTPSELKKVHGGERRPNSREEWLDVQARALRQAAGRAVDALIAASRKTYTVKGV